MIFDIRQQVKSTKSIHCFIIFIAANSNIWHFWFLEDFFCFLPPIKASLIKKIENKDFLR